MFSPGFPGIKGALPAGLSLHASFSLRVGESWEELSRLAADTIVAELRRTPDLLLCAAAGESPTLIYRHLTEAHSLQPELFAQVRVIALDEWGALPRGAAASCTAYLEQHLLEPLQIPPHRWMGFKSDAADVETECGRVQSWLDREGPIDLCVVGLGINGHLGLIEPAASLQPHTHRATLSNASLAHRMLAGSPHQPTFGYTLGIADLLAASTIMLAVKGEHKRGPMQQFLGRDVSTHFPASFLWLHRAVTCYCDAAAIPPHVVDQVANSSFTA